MPNKTKWSVWSISCPCLYRSGFYFPPFNDERIQCCLVDWSELSIFASHSEDKKSSLSSCDIKGFSVHSPPLIRSLLLATGMFCEFNLIDCFLMRVKERNCCFGYSSLLLNKYKHLNEIQFWNELNVCWLDSQVVQYFDFCVV